MHLQETQVGVHSGNLFHRVNIPHIRLQMPTIRCIQPAQIRPIHFEFMQITI